MANFTLVGALSLIIGAFVASAAAALGGKKRDDEMTIRLPGGLESERSADPLRGSPILPRRPPPLLLCSAATIWLQARCVTLPSDPGVKTGTAHAKIVGYDCTSERVARSI